MQSVIFRCVPNSDLSASWLDGHLSATLQYGYLSNLSVPRWWSVSRRETSKKVMCGPRSKLTICLPPNSILICQRGKMANWQYMLMWQDGDLSATWQEVIVHDGERSSMWQDGDLSATWQNWDLSSTWQGGELSSTWQNGDLLATWQDGDMSATWQDGELSSTSQDGDLSAN